MARALRLLFGLAALLAFAGSPAQAQDAANQAFTVTGIDVDFSAKDSMQARYAAYRYAQRQAWKQLWQRMTGSGGAPALGDSALDGMVDGIEVEAERFSSTRYIARLGVVFDRVRAGKYLGQATKTLTSQPMLLIPVLDDGGARTVYEGRSPWLKAWARFRAGATPIQYVRADGTSGDTVMLSAYQARRPDRKLWASILARYSAADVLIAEAKLTRSYPGGPIVGVFTARHGPDGELLGRYRYRTANASGIDNLLDAGVRAVDIAYGNALRAGALRSDPALAEALAPVGDVAPVLAPVSAGGVEAIVATPDAASWAATERALKSTPTVSGVTLISLSLGGNSRIRIRITDTFDWLAYNLDQRGLRLEGGVLRRKLPGDPPIERPMTAEDMEAAANAATGAAPVPSAPKPAPPAPIVAPKPAAPGPKPAVPGAPPKGPANLLPAQGK